MEQCILVIDAGYFLTREVVKALQSEGHRTVVIPLRLPADDSLPDPIAYNAFLQNVIDATEREHPQALLTINHLGFDASGRLTELLETLELPTLVWYVDSPRYILLDYLSNVSDMVGIFLWDRSYQSWMRHCGFEKVETLPLATDPDIFAPKTESAARVESFPLEQIGRDERSEAEIAPLVFVGDSMAFAVEKALEKLPPKLRLGAATGVSANADGLIEHFCDIALSPSAATKPGWEILAELLGAEEVANSSEKNGFPSENLYNGVHFGSAAERLNFESALVLMATRLQRNRLVKELAFSLSPDHLVVYGDVGWKQVLNGTARILPPVDYYQNLPRVYREAGGVVNITGLQMPNALNQRCYDVPACGGFLLTDAREAIREQFEPDIEVVVYESREELLDKWAYFSRSAQERARLIERGRQRVLKEHTYRHRVRSMLQIARTWFS